MPVTISTVVSIVGLVLAAAGAGAGIVFAYGRLTERTDKHAERLKTHEDDINEIFNRLRGLEGVAPILQTTVEKLEKIMSNGLGSKIAAMDIRLTRLEQHCADVHRDLQARGIE